MFSIGRLCTVPGSDSRGTGRGAAPVITVETLIRIDHRAAIVRGEHLQGIGAMLGHVSWGKDLSAAVDSTTRLLDPVGLVWTVDLQECGSASASASCDRPFHGLSGIGSRRHVIAGRGPRINAVAVDLR